MRAVRHSRILVIDSRFRIMNSLLIRASILFYYYNSVLRIRNISLENYNKLLAVFSFFLSLSRWHGAAKWAIIKEWFREMRHWDPVASLNVKWRVSTTAPFIPLGPRWGLKMRNLKKKREVQPRERQRAASHCVFAFVLIVTIQRRLRDQHWEHAPRRVAPSRAERSGAFWPCRIVPCGRCNKSPHRSASEALAIKKGKIWMHHGTHSHDAERGKLFSFFCFHDGRHRATVPRSIASRLFLFPYFVRMRLHSRDCELWICNSRKTHTSGRCLLLTCVN